MIDAYLIYNPNDQRSIEKTNICIESAKKFNINVTLVPGIYNNIIDTLESRQLRLPVEKQLRDRTFFNNESGPLIGVIGCALSHYTVWDKISKSSKPCLVLEHDTEILEDIEHLLPEVDDYIHLDGARKLTTNDYTEFQNGINQLHILKKSNDRLLYSLEWNINWLRGAHGYLLSPKGAKKLLDWTNQYFILPADWALNNNVINVQYCTNKMVGVNCSTLTESDTHASIDKFDDLDIKGFFLHIQKNDLFMINDFDQVVKITPEQNMKRKSAIWHRSLVNWVDNDEIYKIAVSDSSIEEFFISTFGTIPNPIIRQSYENSIYLSNLVSKSK